MKEGKFIFIFLFGLAIYSCNEEKELNPSPKPEIEYSIIGEWIWILSCGGYGGDCFTPETTGDALSITFTQSDSVFIVANSDTVIKADFLIRKAENYITTREADVIYINCDTAFTTQGGYFLIAPENFNRFVLLSLNDTLRLHEDCCDCYGHTFIRKKE